MGFVRLLLAFAVMAGHAQVLDFEILPGDIAVRAFFLISGFYMALILSGEYAGKPKSVFYLNRLLRLYPTYLAALAAQTAVFLIWGLHPLTNRDSVLFLYDEGGTIPIVHALTNLFIVGQEVLYWLGMDIWNSTYFWNVPPGPALSGFTMTMLPQAWALSTEFMFYLAAPFLVRRKAGLLFSLLVASLALRFMILSGDPGYGDFTQRFPPAQFYLFAAGMLVYRFYARFKESARLKRAGWVLLGAVVAHVFLYRNMGAAWRDYSFIILVAAALPCVFRLSARSALDRFLGRVSYPFYLLHFMIATVYEYLAGDYSYVELTALVVLCSIIVVLAVEYPIDRCRRGKFWRKRTMPPAPPEMRPQVQAA